MSRDYYDERGHRRRYCCDTTYDCTHTNDCPEWGDAARAAKPHRLTADGWCMNHSTAGGPVYCEAVES